MKSTEFIKEMTAGATGTGAIATTPMGKGKKKKDVGSLFGGTYKQTNEGKFNPGDTVIADWGNGKKMKATVVGPDSQTHGKALEIVDVATGKKHAIHPSFLSQVVSELDQGPGANDPRRQTKGPVPQVKHGAVRSDPAKIDYSAYGDQAKATKEKQSAAKKAAARERARAERAAERAAKPQVNLDTVMMDIESAIGNAFPDGDPIDYLMKKYSNQYGEIDMKTLDQAVKKNTHQNTFYDYLADVWDEHLSNYNDENYTDQLENPWR